MFKCRLHTNNCVHVCVLTGFEVSFGVEHDLRCAVPARGHVLRQHSLVVPRGVRNSGQTKVANLGRTEREREREREREEGLSGLMEDSRVFSNKMRFTIPRINRSGKKLLPLQTQAF